MVTAKMERMGKMGKMDKMDKMGNLNQGLTPEEDKAVDEVVDKTKLNDHRPSHSWSHLRPIPIYCHFVAMLQGNCQVLLYGFSP